MKPTAYTTQEELAYMKKDGSAFLYEHIHSDHGIALFTEKQLKEAVDAERTACIEVVERFANSNPWGGATLLQAASVLRVRGKNEDDLSQE